MIPEARLVAADGGLVPDGEGWFVVNARDGRWVESAEFGRWIPFEGDPRFPELGINVSVLAPGQPGGMYHGEDAQEDFLVLAGECIALVEGEERRLRQWDFLHCPAWTEHIIVGAGDGPCVLLAVGARGGERGIHYPVSQIALAHNAGVTTATDEPNEAYAAFRPRSLVPYRAGDLP